MKDRKILINEIYANEKPGWFGTVTSTGWNNLGVSYFKANNYLVASQCFREALELNKKNSSTHYNLGVLFRDGLGVRQDKEQAAKHFSAAFEYGDTSACDQLLNLLLDVMNANGWSTANQWNSLGADYYLGTNLAMDYQRARLCYNEAIKIKPNNRYANYNLGQLYQYGYGVEQSYATAKSYYEISANHGSQNAIAKLSLCCNKLAFDPTNTYVWTTFQTGYYAYSIYTLSQLAKLLSPGQMVKAVCLQFGTPIAKLSNSGTLVSAVQYTTSIIAFITNPVFFTTTYYLSNKGYDFLESQWNLLSDNQKNNWVWQEIFGALYVMVLLGATETAKLTEEVANTVAQKCFDKIKDFFNDELSDSHTSQQSEQANEGVESPLTESISFERLREIVLRVYMKLIKKYKFSHEESLRLNRLLWIFFSKRDPLIKSEILTLLRNAPRAEPVLPIQPVLGRRNNLAEEAMRKVAEEVVRKAAEKKAAEEAARKAADKKAAEEAARKAADKKAAEEAARKAADKKAAEEAARKAADKKAAEESARKAADKKAAEESARKAAEIKAAEEAARKATEIKAAEEAARKAAEIKAAEEAARKVAEIKAAEEAARKAAEIKAAEEAARKAAEIKAAEEAARKAAEIKAAEEAARKAAEIKAAEEAARKAAEIKAAEEAARKAAEIKAAEEAARKAAEKKAAEEAARKAAEKKAAEEAARKAAEKKAAEEAARKVAEKKAARIGPLQVVQRPSVQPAVQQPAVQQPVVQQPAVQQPAVQQPVVQQPVVQQPVVQQPAVQQPAVQQPVVQQPAVQQPAVQQPAVQQPAVQQPVVQQPVVEQPIQQLALLSEESSRSSSGEDDSIEFIPNVMMLAFRQPMSGSSESEEDSGKEHVSKPSHKEDSSMEGKLDDSKLISGEGNQDNFISSDAMIPDNTTATTTTKKNAGIKKIAQYNPLNVSVFQSGLFTQPSRFSKPRHQSIENCVQIARDVNKNGGSKRDQLDAQNANQAKLFYKNTKLISASKDFSMKGLEKYKLKNG